MKSRNGAGFYEGIMSMLIQKMLASFRLPTRSLAVKGIK